jgi:hypothetical protein
LKIQKAQTEEQGNEPCIIRYKNAQKLRDIQGNGAAFVADGGISA